MTIVASYVGGRRKEATKPDICVFDLDPAADEPARLRAAALLLRDFLEELGLVSWVKTSGVKGLHIAVPLDGRSSCGVVARFAHTVGARLALRDPENLTQEFYKADRRGRILVDTGRNEYSATFAAVYAVRPSEGRRCPRPARGRRSSAARPSRQGGRCAPWQGVWPRSGICGPR